MSRWIREISAWVVEVPYLEEWVSSPEFGPHSSGRARTLIRVRDREGSEGWGESAGDVLEMVEKTTDLIFEMPGPASGSGFLDLWRPGEIYWNRPVSPSPFRQDPADIRHRLRHPLQALWEAALTDLRARSAGLSVSDFWGGRWREKVAVDYWAGRVTPERAAVCAERAVSLGFRGIKLKTALEDPNCERLAAIQDRVGREFSVTLDPNGRFYRLDEAWRKIRDMDAIGNLNTLEDPFPRFHLEEFVELRRRISARVVVHLDPEESFSTVIKSGAAGGLNIDSHRVGGFQWRVLAGAAEAFNLLIWHGGTGDLGIGTAWQLHLAASAPNCRLPGDQAGPWLRASTIIQQNFDIQDGAVSVPQGPGIGVDVDFNELDRFCRRTKTWQTNK